MSDAAALYVPLKLNVDFYYYGTRGHRHQHVSVTLDSRSTVGELRQCVRAQAKVFKDYVDTDACNISLRLPRDNFQAAYPVEGDDKALVDEAFLGLYASSETHIMARKEPYEPMADLTQAKGPTVSTSPVPTDSEAPSPTAPATSAITVASKTSADTAAVAPQASAPASALPEPSAETAEPLAPSEFPPRQGESDPMKEKVRAYTIYGTGRFSDSIHPEILYRCTPRNDEEAIFVYTALRDIRCSVSPPSSPPRRLHGAPELPLTKDGGPSRRRRNEIKEHLRKVRRLMMEKQTDDEDE